jgi:hypothetical protein
MVSAQIASKRAHLSTNLSGPIADHFRGFQQEAGVYIFFPFTGKKLPHPPWTSLTHRKITFFLGEKE